MYTPEFATDPYAAYAHMRQRCGSLAPVYLHPDVPATLVIGYHTAVRILHDPERFPADPRIWQQTVPAGCPVLPMLEHRPNALRSTGEVHDRYRAPNVDAIDNVRQHVLHATVQQIALPLINEICGAGRADLLAQYAHPLAFQVLNAILGCPPEIGERVAAGMAAIFEGGANAAEGNAMLAQALAELVDLKRRHPGMDITTGLLMHPVGLDDVEMLHQLVTLYGAGIEPLANLIANTLRLILSDERFSGDILRGNLSVRDALDELLFVDPPLANYCVSYPRFHVEVDGVVLPANQPVVISMAACNNDPAIASDYLSGNRSHLTWSAGPHVCPAQSLAYLIAQVAIEQILDALPEMELTVPVAQLTYRPGPFHRSLTGLPVRFPATPPLALA
ncbi:cytochrome P450 [Streptomyces sp. S.PNR 29]|uniref:cytochrome P450 n=1 Tax=Streptomyces sp. S.PNR 29 TaxID=2973805 RepID=UPI0025B1750E|nr:cytochrome P450 [Streptomyces sp. S.PNR 29]MDN0193863.1 cytochrome P450 [Streptomyces sp. S.PNR 29]